MAKDVTEPLTKLKEGADTVNRISAEAKRVTRDVRTTFDRCRKAFNRYVTAHRQAHDLSVAAGLEPPKLWLPPEYSQRPARTRPSIAPTGQPPAGLSPQRISAPTNGPAFDSVGAGASPSRPVVATPDAVPPSPGAQAHVAASHQPVPSDYALPSEASATSADPSVARDLISPAKPLRLSSARHVDDPSVDGIVCSSAVEAGALSDPDATDTAPSMDGSGMPPVSPADALAIPVTSTSLDTAQAALDFPAAGPATAPQPSSAALPPATIAAPPASPATISVPGASPTSPISVGSGGPQQTSNGASVASGSISAPPSSRVGSASFAAPPYGPSVAAQRPHHPGSRTQGVDRDDAESVSTTGSATTDVSQALGSRWKAFGSSVMNVLGAPPAYVGPATQTTAERIESMRQTAAHAQEAAGGALAEVRGAWEAHERAKRDFSSQITAAATLFAELEKRRVGEISDSLRRYTVFVSSMFANLQYDVNRLATKFEDAGSLALAVAAAAGEEAAAVGPGTTLPDSEPSSASGSPSLLRGKSPLLGYLPTAGAVTTQMDCALGVYTDRMLSQCGFGRHSMGRDKAAAAAAVASGGGIARQHSQAFSQPSPALGPVAAGAPHHHHGHGHGALSQHSAHAGGHGMSMGADGGDARSVTSAPPGQSGLGIAFHGRRGSGASLSLGPAAAAAAAASSHHGHQHPGASAAGGTSGGGGGYGGFSSGASVSGASEGGTGGTSAWGWMGRALSGRLGGTGSALGSPSSNTSGAGVRVPSEGLTGGGVRLSFSAMGGASTARSTASELPSARHGHGVSGFAHREVEGEGDEGGPDRGDGYSDAGSVGAVDDDDAEERARVDLSDGLARARSPSQASASVTSAGESAPFSSPSGLARLTASLRGRRNSATSLPGGAAAGGAGASSNSGGSGFSFMAMFGSPQPSQQQQQQQRPHGEEHAGISAPVFDSTSGDGGLRMTEDGVTSGSVEAFTGIASEPTAQPIAAGEADAPGSDDVMQLTTSKPSSPQQPQPAAGAAPSRDGGASVGRFFGFGKPMPAVSGPLRAGPVFAGAVSPTKQWVPKSQQQQQQTAPGDSTLTSQTSDAPAPSGGSGMRSRASSTASLTGVGGSLTQAALAAASAAGSHQTAPALVFPRGPLERCVDALFEPAASIAQVEFGIDDSEASAGRSQSGVPSATTISPGEGKTKRGSLRSLANLVKPRASSGGGGGSGDPHQSVSSAPLVRVDDVALGLDVTAGAVSRDSDGGSSLGGALPSISLSDFASGLSPRQPEQASNVISAQAALGAAFSSDVDATARVLALGDAPLTESQAFEVSDQPPQQPSETSSALATDAAVEPVAEPSEAAPAQVLDQRQPEGPLSTHPQLPALLPAAVRVVSDDEDGLARLITALDGKRHAKVKGGVQPLTSESLARLAELVMAGLDVAQASADFPAGRALMEMAQTFYGVPQLQPTATVAADAAGGSNAGPARGHGPSGASAPVLPHTPGASRKTYLQSLVAPHPLLHDEAFWASVASEALASVHASVTATAAAASASSSTAGGSKPAGAAGAHPPRPGAAAGGANLSRADRERREREIAVAVGQLRLVAYSMASFGVPTPTVQAVIVQRAAKHQLGLDATALASLAATVAGFTQAGSEAS